jgi:hypothetical protein
MKSKGPIIPPCGTPTDTGNELDNVLLIDVFCWWLVR